VGGFNDDVADCFMMEEDIPEDMLLSAICEGNISERIPTAICGSINTLVGVEVLLEFIRFNFSRH
jgi:hypothetical protein